MADRRRDKRSDETTSSGDTAATSISAALKDVLPLLEPPTDDEAKLYYSGLPSHPRLVGRTSSGIRPWERVLLNPGEPFSVYRHCVMSPIGEHAIRQAWQHVHPQIVAALSELPWTSIDLFRIGPNDVSAKERPVVVWVGIDPSGNASWDSVALALRKCRHVLDSASLDDVECEMRASKVFDLAGLKPRLLSPAPEHDAFFSIKRPFTTTIDQSVFRVCHGNIYGTLCAYLRSTRSDNPKWWALTCRHVALPNSVHTNNEHYEWKNNSQPALKICLTRSEVVSDALSEIQFMKESSIERLADSTTDEERSKEQALIDETTALYAKLLPFKSLEARAIGSVSLAPPIGVGSGRPYPWTRDWALIELDKAKFPPAGPTTEVDLRTGDPFCRQKLQRLLNPNVQNKEKFVFPRNGVLRLRGIIPVAEMQNPTTLDKDGNECILVGKRGAATDLTWGCPSELMSTVRTCLPDGGSFVSTEWAVKGQQQLDNRYSSFSGRGDSGAAVFDVHGRLGGMLTRGSSSVPGTVDITYVTPMEMLLQNIEKTLGTQVALM